MTHRNTLAFNPILAADSYKLSHAFAYPKSVTGMFSYIEARTNGRDIIVPFGLQMFVRKFLTVPITRDMVDEAEQFAAAHGEPFYVQAGTRLLIFIMVTYRLQSWQCLKEHPYAAALPL